MPRNKQKAAMEEAPQREAQQLTQPSIEAPMPAPLPVRTDAQQLGQYSKQVTLTHSQIRLIASTLQDREEHWYEKASKSATPGGKVYCELLGQDVGKLREQMQELIR